MILVADSGSTKCDWILADGTQRIHAETMGFNPFFHSQTLIETKLSENEILDKYKSSIKEVYFYGAGCSSLERNLILKNALSGQYKNADKIVIAEDLKGAIHSTSGNKPSIVCILGTGSNSCYFDGSNIHKGNPSLGYILGDEGSGSYFGKHILSQYLSHQLPQDISAAFDQYYNISLDNILTSIYNKPNANVYLASFMKFIGEHKEHPYFKEMIYNGLKKFAELHIVSFKEYKNTKVNFVGSIAYFFQKQLTEVSKDLGFTIGTIIRRPIDTLTDYHL